MARMCRRTLARHPFCLGAIRGAVECTAASVDKERRMVKLTVYGQTDIGLVRRSNEDAFVIADLTGDSLLDEQRMAQFEVGQSGVLLAVSDGMGGHQAGEVASALVVQSLRRAMASQRDTEPSDALLEKATAQANHEV